MIKNGAYSTREAFEMYIYFNAMKKHFIDEKYDFMQYHGKIRASVDKFQTKKDRFYYYKLSKRSDAKDFTLSNLIDNPNVWIGDLMDNDKHETIYKDWLKRKQALTHFFEIDLDEADSNFDANFTVTDGQHPKLIKLYIQRRISLETLVILMDLSNVKKYWEKNISDRIVFPDINKLCAKYKPFFLYDRYKMKKIVLDKFG